MPSSVVVVVQLKLVAMDEHGAKSNRTIGVRVLQVIIPEFPQYSDPSRVWQHYCASTVTFDHSLITLLLIVAGRPQHSKCAFCCAFENYYGSVICCIVDFDCLVLCNLL